MGLTIPLSSTRLAPTAPCRPPFQALTESAGCGPKSQSCWAVGCKWLLCGSTWGPKVVYMYVCIIIYIYVYIYMHNIMYIYIQWFRDPHSRTTPHVTLTMWSSPLTSKLFVLAVGKSCLRAFGAWMNLDDNIFVQQNEAVRVNDSGITIICDLWGWINPTTVGWIYPNAFLLIFLQQSAESKSWRRSNLKRLDQSDERIVHGSNIWWIWLGCILYQWFRLGTSSHTDVDCSPLDMFKPWKSECVG